MKIKMVFLIIILLLSYSVLHAENREEYYGSQKKENTEESPRLSFFLSPMGYITIGNISNTIPWGIGLSLNIYLQLDDFLYSNKSLLLPDLNTEIGYLNLGFSSERANGLSVAIGPVWFIPVIPNGDIYLSLLFGIGSYEIKVSDYQSSSGKFTLGVICGFRYSLGWIVLMPHIRYSLIYDSEIPLNCFGFGIGVSFGFMQW